MIAHIFFLPVFCLLVGHYSELAGDAILSTEPGIKRRPRLGHKEDCKQGQKLFTKALNHLKKFNNATGLQATLSATICWKNMQTQDGEYEIHGHDFCSCSYYCTLQKVWQNSVIIFSHQEERSQQSWQGRVLICSPGTPMLTFGQHKKPSILIFNRCTIHTLFQEISLVKNEFSKFTQFHLWNNRGTFISSPW